MCDTIARLNSRATSIENTSLRRRRRRRIIFYCILSPNSIRFLHSLSHVIPHPYTVHCYVCFALFSFFRICTFCVVVDDDDDAVGRIYLIDWANESSFFFVLFSLSTHPSFYCSSETVAAVVVVVVV